MKTQSQLKKTFFLTAALLSLNMGTFAQTQIGNDINGEGTDDYSGTSISMPDANTIAIGAPTNYSTGQNGQVRVYTLSGNSWVQKGGDIDGYLNGVAFGSVVSMPDANTLAVGAYQGSGLGIPGYARVYSWNGSAWIQKGNEFYGSGPTDGLGVINMPDANTIAIGAIGGERVEVYSWNGSAWIQKGSDINREAANDVFGYSLSMPDVNTIAIGAPQNDGGGADAGHVRVYTWSGSAWMQKGSDIDGDSAYGRFGSVVDMPDGNTVAVGAPDVAGNGYQVGLARVYSWNGSAWIKKGNDIKGDNEYDGWGRSVSMPDANTLAVGAPTPDSAGYVRIYTWSGGNWVQKGGDIIGGTATERSGMSVNMPDVNTLAIGAPENNNANGTLAGTVRVYSFVNVGIEQNDFGNTLLIYPNPTQGDVALDMGSTYSDIKVVIRTEIGQVVKKQTFSIANKLQFILPEEAGIYFIEVNAGSKKALLKVIKE